MAAIVWTDVTSAAPELVATGAQTQTDILAFVNVALNVTLYDGENGPRTRLSRIYLAAHLATVASLGAAGPLVGESAGGLSRQYAPPSWKSKLATTSYGTAFLALSPPAARGPQVL